MALVVPEELCQEWMVSYCRRYRRNISLRVLGQILPIHRLEGMTEVLFELLYRKV